MKRIDEEEIEFDEYGIAFHEGEPYSGESAEKDINGNIVAILTYSQGYEHGPWREWYPNGNPLIEGTVELGKGAVGVWKKWHENGNLARERTFDDRGRTLAIREWREDGTLTVDNVYSNPI